MAARRSTSTRRRAPPAKPNRRPKRVSGQARGQAAIQQRTVGFADSGLPFSACFPESPHSPGNDTQSPPPSGISLRWVRTPVKTYRARYVNELSKRGNCRGALEAEDDTGDAWPVVKLFGVSDQDIVHLDVYAATSDGQPHPFFFCKTAGRDAPTTCHNQELNDGCQALRFTARASNNFVCDLKHVGIVRRQKDVVLRGSDRSTACLGSSQTNYFHLNIIARMSTATSTGVPFTVTLLSEAIKCISSTQAISHPAVQQVIQLGERSHSDPVGVLVLGKDFVPSTHFRVFKERKDGSIWQITIQPEDCTWLCSHNCLVTIQMPQPPKDIVRSSSGEVVVHIDAAPNTTRHNAKSVSVNRDNACDFKYPKDYVTACLDVRPRQIEAVHPAAAAAPPTTGAVSTSSYWTHPAVNLAPTFSEHIHGQKNSIADLLPTPPSTTQVDMLGLDLGSVCTSTCALPVVSNPVDLVTSPYAFSDYAVHAGQPSPYATQGLMKMASAAAGSVANNLHSTSFPSSYSLVQSPVSCATSPGSSLLGINDDSLTLGGWKNMHVSGKSRPMSQLPVLQAPLSLMDGSDLSEGRSDIDTAERDEMSMMGSYAWSP